MTIEIQSPWVADPPSAEPVPLNRADRRHALRATERAFRPRRVVPALIVGAVVTALAALAAIEIFSRMAHHRIAVLPVGWLTHFGRTTYANDTRIYVIAGVVAAIGILLLWFALRPGHRHVVGLSGGDTDVVLGISNGGMNRQLANAALTVDGISRAKVSVGRHRIAVRTASPLRDTAGLDDQVREAVTARLTEFEPLRDRKVRVVVRKRKD
jgi:hypothetical protein